MIFRHPSAKIGLPLLGLMLSILPLKVIAGGCDGLLLIASKSFVSSHNGITTGRLTPKNSKGWAKVEPPETGTTRNPNEAEFQQIERELSKIREIFGDDSLPVGIKFVFTTGTAHYDSQTKTVYTKLESDRSGNGVINAGVLWHECGHALADKHGQLAKSGWTIEAAYDEFFADIVAWMRNSSPEELLANGGAFSEGVNPKGWIDHEEHQALIPARSALGHIITRGLSSDLTSQQKRFIGKTVLETLVAERAKIPRDQIERGRNTFNATPESLNVSLIQQLRAAFRQ